MDRAMRKRLFEHMRDSEGADKLAHPHSLIRTFRITGYYRIYERRSKARMKFAHPQNDLNLRILCML